MVNILGFTALLVFSHEQSNPVNRHSFSAGFHTTQVMDTLARAYIRKGESREGAAAGSLVSGRGGDRTVGGLGYLDGCGL